MKSLHGILLALLCLCLLHGCLFSKVNEQVRLGRQTTILTGQIRSVTPLSNPLVVLAYQKRTTGIDIVHFTTLHEAGSYELIVPQGEYLLFAFEDGNRNLVFDEGELHGHHGEPTPVEAPNGGVVFNLNITVDSERLRSPSLPAGTIVSPVVPEKFHSTLAGYIADLDEPLYSVESGQRGYWAPIEFFREVGGNIYFLEPYDPAKIPVLFVHGAAGSPQDWRYFLNHIDREKYQPWIYFYPSGASLRAMGNLLSKKLFDLQAMYHFPRMVLTAHSMGGLVSRNFLLDHGVQHPYINLFVTIATPWGGVKSAEKGVEISPFTISSWRDVVPDSPFIQSLYKRKLPEGISYYMFFGHKGNRYPWATNNDGSVSLESQLDYRAQADSKGTYGFNEDHTSILFSKDVLSIYNAILKKREEQASGDASGFGQLRLKLKTDLADGKVPSQVTLLLTPEGEDRRESQFYINSGKTKSVVGPLLPGVYEASVIAPAFRPEPLRSRVTIQAGKTSEVAFTLSPRAVVYGWIVGKEGQTQKTVGMYQGTDASVPVESVTLRGLGVTRKLAPAEDRGQSLEQMMGVHEDFLHHGTFCFFDLKPGIYLLTIRAEGYQAYEKVRKVVSGKPGFTRGIRLQPLGEDGLD